MEKALLLIGDSNVRRSINLIGSLYNQMVHCLPGRNLAELEVSLSAVKSSYKIVVLSVLTNIIVDAGTNTDDRSQAIDGAMGAAIEAVRCVI